MTREEFKQFLIETLEKIKSHLLTQGEPSFEQGKGCLYRGPDDLKCAIGCLIPDEKYSPSLEGNSVAELDDDVFNARHAEMSYSQRGEYAEYLQKAQQIHDYSSTYLWERQMTELIEQVRGLK